MPRHVLDGDAKAAPRELLGGQEIEVVAAHVITGDHPARHFEAGQPRGSLEQQTPLDVGGHRQRVAQHLILGGQRFASQGQLKVRG